MKDAMQDAELKPRRIVLSVLSGLLVVLVAFSSVFALLRAWHLPPGGEGGSAGLVSAIPEPRLQSAPQLDRQLEFDQRLGAHLPRSTALRESDGRALDWQALAADGRPLVLLPAYYSCQTLCGTAAHGALEALADTGLPPSSWHLLLFSVDPQDTPATAAALRSVYVDYARYARPQVYDASAPPDLRLLSGPAADTADLARAIGFHWQGASGAHPTGFVVLTPDGTVSRYFLGVRHSPAALRAALVEASQGRVGSLADRLLLACAHLDPRFGARDGAVMMGVRLLALGVLAGLLLWILRRRPRR